MRSLRISEVAAETGFSPSTLRYYEDVGLLPGLERSEAGYRLFDDRAVRRLRLIARAKELGLSLEEISEVASIWDRDECAPVQARLVALVTQKSSDARARMAQLGAFADELDAALESLDRYTAAGACDDECGCTTDSATLAKPVMVSLGRAPQPPVETPIVCTLAPEMLHGRLVDWRATLRGAVSAEPTEHGVAFRFAHGVDVAELATLAVAEQRCCSFLTFGLGIEPDEVTLEIRGPADARPLLDEFVELSR